MSERCTWCGSDGRQQDRIEELQTELADVTAERDRQAAWAAYYRRRWLGEEAVPPAPLPAARAALAREK